MAAGIDAHYPRFIFSSPLFLAMTAFSLFPLENLMPIPICNITHLICVLSMRGKSE
ncbi:hypothetical protein EDWATA_01136 [Edwardsiella tarda ATCC 23685]|uniref:Uncharacterized protein n=1 Tax=Edwardsiella tarda ATCC 23685 TaxID=500638 RepID=D4F334_EDWTA|nr:hypothetical protein EDWATA_01136 [Edwardsiella tarda ATCC 23685]